MQVSQIDGAYFPRHAMRFDAFLRPPGTEKWARPFPLLMRRVRGVGEREGPGWNMIPQNVHRTERRTRERAMIGRKERAIMINLTNAR
jgi:hypothetical protein